MQITDYPSLLQQLEHLSDAEYKAFNLRITPDIGPTYGVRVPLLKGLANHLYKQGLTQRLLPELQQGRSFEERLLFGYLIAKQSYADEAHMFAQIQNYIALINNWALCDSFASAIRPLVKDHRQAFWEQVAFWVEPDHSPWAIRFGLVVLNNYFAEPQHLNVIFGYLDTLKNSEHYYVKMAMAWLLSTLYFCDRERVALYLQTAHLSPWIVNKAVQKILESRRLDSTHREAVKNLKRL